MIATGLRVARIAAYALVVVISSSQAGKADPAVVVRMTDRHTFEPEEVRIRAGETVRWINSSALEHTVTADPMLAMIAGDVHLPQGAEPFHSGRLPPRSEYEHTFQTPGEYQYVCVPHEVVPMIGRVVVEKRQP